MNILAVTLARGGSKGIPNKHTRILGGKPLLAWTIEAVQKSKYDLHYMVSSDDEIIRQIARLMDVWTIQRPPELALDTTPTLPALQHAVREVEKFFGITADYVVEVRATSPFKTTEDIDGIIKTLIDSDAESVIGVTALEDRHPARAKRLVNGYIKDFCVHEPANGRRQDLKPRAYVRNGTVYAFRRDAVMPPNGKLFGHKTSIGYEMPAERSVNIDTPLDWLLCEAILKGRDDLVR